MCKSSNRWNRDNEKPGSWFHELVTLPMLAPDLARPGYLHAHSGDPVVHPQPRSQQLMRSVVMTDIRDTNSGPTSSEQPAKPAPECDGSSICPATPLQDRSVDSNSEAHTPERVFYLNVALERTEQTFTSRGPGKPKTTFESKPGPQLAVASLSHVEVVHHILAVHGLEDRGGQKNAPTVRDDEDWNNLTKQLSATKGSVDTIQIMISLKDLEPYKGHKRALSPDPVEEVTRGTYTRVATYSVLQQKTGARINEIKQYWPCQKHGHCYIDFNCEHIELNRFRLNAWAAALIADDNILASQPPPEELLLEWRSIRPMHVPLPKRRGVTGPHRDRATASSDMNSGADFGAVLTSLAGPFIKSLANIAVTSLSTSLNPPVPQSPHRLSSPPPAVEDELVACLRAFGSARRLSQDSIDKAIGALEEAAYTPDIMGDAKETRLVELTGLAEGHAIALVKFSREWCGKIDGKRARRV
ncbi:hypothetical protein BV22DRAFT_1048078 [Leucogyrophana mollusca]|uniref:Uncharacterized protein n=1 Tax=Leucogyrophana mollusca TaxID=85980 RepID=A0ACB8BD31_9AGAM|nr:hypothetical protein BV22DRAFT_1048078 [Leucogyrophana mollusca]